MFIIKFDDALVLRLGEIAVYIRSMLDTYTSNLGVIEDLSEFKLSVEYLNYLITIFMPIYLLLKRMTYDALFIKIEKIIGSVKEKKKSNIIVKNTARQNNCTSSNDREYKVNSALSDGNSNYYGNLYNYNDLDNETYTHNSLFNNKEKFTIMSDYDKERAYEMSMVKPFEKVVDESGIEMYAWEYGNIYEEEKRQEEFNFQQEQFLYSSNSDYDYPIYNPYDNNDAYSSSYNDDYYGNSYDNNDSWF